jgi:hypothetical protein
MTRDNSSEISIYDFLQDFIGNKGVYWLRMMTYDNHFIIVIKKYVIAGSKNKK